MGLIRKTSELVIPETVKMMIYGQAGMGKAQPLFCNVLTPNGYKKLADISVGDQIMGRNGKSQKVLGVYPQGVRPVYKVTTNDGAVTYCDEEHIWTVRASSGNSRKAGFRNMTLKEMLSKGIVCNQTPREERTGRKAMPRFEIPMAECMEYSEREFEVNPYILGVLIGDGSLIGNVALFSNPDKDSQVSDIVRELLPQGYTINKNEASNCPQYSIVLVGNGEGYIQRIKRLNLNVHSGDKFIPKSYKLGSHAQRISLLRGLMDTDGFAFKNRVYFSTSSKTLAYDFVDLVNSLGGIANIHLYERDDKSDEYRVSVRIKECPFLLERKANEWKESSVSRYITDVTRVDSCECACIKVSNNDELYITDNYIVTHNTTVALSSPSPLLLDFDNGVKRVNLAHLEGVDSVQVTSWNDIKEVVQEDLSSYKTIVVDTVGKMMDFIITYKCGSRQPFLKDWGGINMEFQWFTRCLSGMNKNIVFVAHRDTRKEGDDTVFIPSLREKSYNSIVTDLDLLGYLEMRTENNRQIRTITFDPTSRNDGKNTCNLPSVMQIPTIIDAKGAPTAKNDFIQKMVINPYVSMLSEKEREQKEYDRLVATMKATISKFENEEQINGFCSNIDSFKHVGSSKAMAAKLVSEKAKELNLSFNKETRKYERPVSTEQIESKQIRPKQIRPQQKKSTNNKPSLL